MQMVMFVLDDPDRLDELLEGLHRVGISGVTLMESSGSYRRQAILLGARHLSANSILAQRMEEGHYTLFTIVPDVAAVEQCLNAIEAVVGDLDQPNSGIFTSWAVGLTKGVPMALQSTGENAVEGQE